MKIYIMRHGEAGFSASSDSARALTAHGIAQAINAGRFLREQQIQIDLALVSPYLRAQQTLQQLASVAIVDRIETEAGLVPSGDASQIRLLATAEPVESLLIVSHLPLVGYLVNEFCPHVSPPMLATADIASIHLPFTGDIPDRVGILEWIHHQ